MAWGENLTPTQGGLIDTSAQTAGNVISSIIQIGENRKNRRFNANQAALAYQRSVEQWNRENEYNLPARQMQRYLDAGLNPNLMYGQQNLAAPAAPAPQASSGAASTVPINVQGNLLAAKQIEAQNKLAEAQANNINELTPAQKRYLQSQYHLNDAQFNQTVAMVDQIKKQSELLESQKDFVNAQAAQAWLNWSFDKQTMNYRAVSLARQADCDVVRANFALAYATQQVALMKAQESQALSQAELNRMNAKVAEYEKDIKSSEAQIIRQSIDYIVNTSKAEMGQAQHIESLLGFQDQYKAQDRTWRLSLGAVGAATDAAGAVSGFMNPTKHVISESIR